jgi:hypothetical protein
MRTVQECIRALERDEVQGEVLRDVAEHLERVMAMYPVEHADFLVDTARVLGHIDVIRMVLATEPHRVHPVMRRWTRDIGKLLEGLRLAGLLSDE